MDGFSKTVRYTRDDPLDEERSNSQIRSIRRQEEWGETLTTERTRVRGMEEKVAALNKCKDQDEREAMLDSIDTDKRMQLPEAIGWPIISEEDEEEEDDADENEDGDFEKVIGSGLPRFPMILQVDMMGGNFKFDTNSLTFGNNLGPLPARATFELTKSLYKTTNSSQSTRDNFPKGIFLSDPDLISESERWNRFRPGKQDMSGFYHAGYHSKQLARMMEVLRTIPDPICKLELLNEFFACILPQFKAEALNGSLRSNHTMCATRNLEAGNGYVCKDLRGLVFDVYSACRKNDVSKDLETQPWSENLESKTFWDVSVPSTFVAFNWLMEDMHKIHNEEFFLMTAQNLKIANDTALSSIMFRMGQHNNFTYIGMPTVVCDAACKLKVRVHGQNAFVPDTQKKPSAGLDLGREALDKR